MGQDLRYAWRMLRRSPGFAALAILTLGLGVGATTTIFTVVNGVLLRPLPYREPDRLANLWVDFGVGAQSLPAMSPGDFRDYQERNRSFEMLAAGSGGQVVGATGALTGTGGEPERVDVSPVTANFLPLLGVDPVYGRHFTAEEEAPGGPKVVILSHGLWKRRYGGDPGIIGARIRLDGLDQTVVGVMPEGFRLWLPSEAFLITDSQIWKPLQFNYANQPPRNFTFFTVFGRLKPGVTFEQAQADLSEIARQLRAEHAVHEAADMQIRVVPLQDDVVKHARRALVALFVAVGFVLLIACANVAHLLLARATAREREMAVRGALGASRARLLRQLSTESLVLAAGGGLVGIALAAAGTRALTWLNPANLPRLSAVRIDGDVLLFAVCASTLTALVFGLVPALRAAGLDLNRTLRGHRIAVGRPGAPAERVDDRRDGARARAAHRRGADDSELRGTPAGAARIRPGGRADVPPRDAAGEVSPPGRSRRVPPPDGGAAPRAAGRHRGRVHVAAPADRQRIAVALRVQRRNRAQLGKRDLRRARRVPRVFPRDGHPPARRAVLRRRTTCPVRAGSSSTRRSRRAPGRASPRSASGSRCSRPARTTRLPK